MNRQGARLKMHDRRTRPGRPKNASKRHAILEAAKQLFLSKGYENTSLDSIAAAANVSKLTLYSHFRDKSDLHFQALRSRCEELTSAHLPTTNHRAVGDRLLAAAQVLFELMTEPEAIAVHRSIVAGARWLQHIPELYWRAVPQHLFEEVARVLRKEHERGAIDIQHPHKAASHFMSLVKGDLHEDLLLGRVAGLDPQSVAEHLREAIAVFQRAYAAERRAPKESKRHAITELSSTCKKENKI